MAHKLYQLSQLLLGVNNSRYSNDNICSASSLQQQHPVQKQQQQQQQTTKTILMDLMENDKEYMEVENLMQTSVREHKDNVGGIYNR